MNKSFDVFLSHNSRDKPAVRELAEALRDRGLNVWLDEWELVPGRPWQEALEEIIESTRSSAVLVGKDGLGPWQDEEMRGCLTEFVERKLPVIPVLLPGAPEVPRLPFFLKRFTWVDLRGGLTEEGLDRLQWGIIGKRPDRGDLKETQSLAVAGPPVPPQVSLLGSATATLVPATTSETVKVYIPEDLDHETNMVQCIPCIAPTPSDEATLVTVHLDRVLVVNSAKEKAFAINEKARFEVRHTDTDKEIAPAAVREEPQLAPINTRTGYYIEKSASFSFNAAIEYPGRIRGDGSYRFLLVIQPIGLPSVSVEIPPGYIT